MESTIFICRTIGEASVNVINELTPIKFFQIIHTALLAAILWRIW